MIETGSCHEPMNFMGFISCCSWLFFIVSLSTACPGENCAVNETTCYCRFCSAELFVHLDWKPKIHNWDASAWNNLNMKSCASAFSSNCVNDKSKIMVREGRKKMVTRFWNMSDDEHKIRNHNILPYNISWLFEWSG